MKNLLKKSLSMLLVMIMAVASLLVFVPSVEVEAETTYDWLWPVNGGTITPGRDYSSSHLGVDIRHNSAGDITIYSVIEGTVIEVFNHCEHIDSANKNSADYNQCPTSHTNKWGNSVIVRVTRPDNTTYDVIYGHLKFNNIFVKKGDYVARGQALAIMGSSGNSTGRHLHLEARGYWGDRGSTINVNGQNKGGPVNYSYYGYQGQPTITPATITGGTYYLKNGDYRTYMIKDERGSGSIGASTSNASDNYKIKVQKDGAYYIMYPEKATNNNILNCYWGSGGTQTQSGNEITLWNNSGDLSQRWIFESYNGGYLIHPVDRPDLSITREGNILYVKTTTKAANQIWTLESPECSHELVYKYDYIDGASSVHWQECTKCDYNTNQTVHTFVPMLDNGAHIATAKGHFMECKYCDFWQKDEHEFDNDCDTLCNICQHKNSEREPQHTYSNDCDTSCNVCGVTRTVGDHKYDNACDTSCNVCGKTRSTTHVFNNACDTTCNVCGLTRQITHTFDNDCDEFCNTCTYSRAISHQYDNGCDKKCNVCGKERITNHIYDNDRDTKCNECGFTRNITKPTTTTTTNTNNTTSNAMPHNLGGGSNESNVITIAIIVGAVAIVFIIGVVVLKKKK